MEPTPLDLIKPIVADKEIEPGVAYVVFSCGCIILQDQYANQKRIFRSRKGKVKAVCPEHRTFDSEYLGRYRICARCDKEEATKNGRGYETNVCKACNASEWDLVYIELSKDKTIDKKEAIEAIRNDEPVKRKIRTKFYQNGIQIDPPKNPETDPLCGNRDTCLDAAGYEGDTFIHCTGCSNWKNWIDI